jgi:hypothetical protein
MMYLITGVPGSGKTLFAVTLIQQWIRDGRTVYANIEGLNIPGVFPSPKDWRETPEGSVVVYDEAQRAYPPEGNAGRSSREDIAAMETHRHTGHDLLFITQHPKLIHSHVRRLIGKHFHLHRMYGTQNAKVFQADQAINTDSKTALNAADQFLFTYPKNIFSLYKSATIHTHRPYLPKFLKRTIIGMLVLVGVIAALWVPSSSFFRGDIGIQSGHASTEKPSLFASSQPSVSAPASSAVLTSDPSKSAPRVSGCISSKSRCICYSPDGNSIPIDEQACRAVASELLVYNIFPSGASSSRAIPAPAQAGALATAAPVPVIASANAAPAAVLSDPSFIDVFGAPPSSHGADDYQQIAFPENAPAGYTF